MPRQAYLEYMKAECEAFATANCAVSTENGWWAGCVRQVEETVPEEAEEPPEDGEAE